MKLNNVQAQLDLLFGVVFSGWSIPYVRDFFQKIAHVVFVFIDHSGFRRIAHEVFVSEDFQELLMRFCPR